MTRYSIADAVDSLLKVPMPLRFTAYDGSATGPEDSPYRVHLATERGLTYVLTAPGDLGFARAYVSGDLEIHGVHPGDPYEAFKLVQSRLGFRRPSPRELVDMLRSLGLSHLRPVAPPHPGGASPLPGPRRRGDPPPLRRLQRVLRVRPRPLDDLHLRGLPPGRRLP